MWPERPPAARWTTSDFLQLKTVFPSTRNDMFWKNLAFRLDETPTSEPGFSGHEHGRPKKASKTQGFSMIYLAGRNSCYHLGPPAAPKNPKTSIFLSKTLGFGVKVKKTQRFFILFGDMPYAECAFIFIRLWPGFRFETETFESQNEN